MMAFNALSHSAIFEVLGFSRSEIVISEFGFCIVNQKTFIS
jgi:hypothetical protein